MVPLQGFFLGLSSGVACVATCAPVLVPYLLAEGNGVARNAFAVGQFLLGRLVGYLAFGVIAWGINRTLLEAAGYRASIMGFTYLALSVLLVWYSLGRIRTPCAARQTSGLAAAAGTTWPLLFVPMMGLLTGLNFCPPFLMALAGAADTNSLAGSLLFFAAFFAGTSLFFLPAPFLGLFHSVAALSTVGRMAAGVMSLYYGYAGLMYLIGGTGRG
jgi:sulfite exporter TauE/SafE